MYAKWFGKSASSSVKADEIRRNNFFIGLEEQLYVYSVVNAQPRPDGYLGRDIHIIYISSLWLDHKVQVGTTNNHVDFSGSCNGDTAAVPSQLLLLQNVISYESQGMMVVSVDRAAAVGGGSASEQYRKKLPSTMKWPSEDEGWPKTVGWLIWVWVVGLCLVWVHIKGVKQKQRK